jgi:hypothetical protein
MHAYQIKNAIGSVREQVMGDRMDVQGSVVSIYSNGACIYTINLQPGWHVTRM